MASVDKVKVGSTSYDISPSKDGTLKGFTSNDAASPTAWTAANAITTSDTNSTIFSKVTTMIKNVRWLYSKLGTTDFSATGQSTVTGALSALQTGLNGKAASSHSHNASQLPISSSQTNSNSYIPTSALVYSMQQQINSLNDATNSLKTSVSEGKSLIAAAVTDKGVNTAASDSFSTMATNIGSIPTGTDTSDGTIEPQYVIKDKVGYANGNRIVGTLDVSSSNLFIVAKYTITIQRNPNGSGNNSSIGLVLKRPAPFNGRWKYIGSLGSFNVTSNAERNAVNAYGYNRLPGGMYNGSYVHMTYGIFDYCSQYGDATWVSNNMGIGRNFNVNIVDQFLWSGTNYETPIYQNGYWYANYKQITRTDVSYND